MIIQVGPHAAWWVSAAAAIALILHVGGGCAGLISGAISMSVHKGGTLHRAAGNIFVGSMLMMAAMAVVTAPLVPARGNIVGGMFTFYLVLTGWTSLRRSTSHAARFEGWAALSAFGIAAGALWIGWLGSRSLDGMVDGQPTQSAYILAAIAILAAGSDLRMALGRSLSATQRLVRHVWRMCVAMFMAAGSFFLGQQQVFPASIRGSPLLLLPVLAPLMLMIYWQIRIRSKRNFLPIRIPIRSI